MRRTAHWPATSRHSRLHHRLAEASSEPPAADGELTPQEQERADAQRALMEQQVGEFDFVLVPRAHGVFMLGFVQDGALLEVADVYHEFEFEGDNAVRMVIRGPDDVVFARGTRRVPQAGGSSDRSGEQ
jgi:hypothetical protein